jgi:hypothetical protein
VTSKFLIRAILAVLAFALAGLGRPAKSAPAESSVVTPLTTVAIGHHRALAYLDANPVRRRLAKATARAAASVVRVQCRDYTNGTEKCERGTGFVLAHGFVLAPGHLLVRHSANARLSVQLADGTEIAATLTGRGHPTRTGDAGDFALLQVSAGSARLPAPLAVGEARSGAEVVMIGFSADAGLGRDGTVVGNRDGAPLAPTWLVGRITDPYGVYIEPVAGCLPQGGFSGAPAIDATGAVVAMQTAVTTTRSEDAPRVVAGEQIVDPPRFRYRVDAARINEVIRTLEEGGGRR